MAIYNPQTHVAVPREATPEIIRTIMDTARWCTETVAHHIWDLALKVAAPQADATEGHASFVCSSCHREVMYYGEGCPVCQLQEALHCKAHPAPPSATQRVDAAAEEICEKFMYGSSSELRAEIAAIIRKHIRGDHHE